jgi:hypothetical protein
MAPVTRGRIQVIAFSLPHQVIFGLLAPRYIIAAIMMAISVISAPTIIFVPMSVLLRIG